ncbi:MAG: DUF2357 domain-containing protein, partial [Thermomicrobiales bacterium]
MDHAAPQATLPLIAANGEEAARLHIVPRTPNTLFRLDPRLAAQRGEASIQLIEGHSYEYRLDGPLPKQVALRESRVLQPSQIHPGSGRIEPGLHTGLLRVELALTPASDHPEAPAPVIATGDIEVRSAKLDYLHDYRLMLADIADRALGLITDMRAPAMTRLQSASGADPATLHQRLALIRALLDSRPFHEALARITAVPDTQRRPLPEFQDLRRGLRPSHSLQATIARHPRRLIVPEGHPVNAHLANRGIPAPSLPAELLGARQAETVDTPANQFVKFALVDIRQFLADIELRLASLPPDDRRWLDIVRQLTETIDAHLAHPLFRDVSMPQSLALGSPVIQRKAGYRELLAAWVRFRMAAQLSWSGGDDVFGAGKRDIAQLYEYWLFFFMLDLFGSVVAADPPVPRDLIAFTADGFDLRLSAGAAFSIQSRVAGRDLPLQARFSYNRTFAGKPADGRSSYPLAGSWTRSMRPDFTFSFWPAALSEADAEERDSLVHLHFDAKYRVDSIATLFGLDDPAELDAEKQAFRANLAPKRADLLKMHAYRDAIRRTQGAYVLYPGTAGDATQWIEYHELLPGLGAFAVRPGNEARSRATFA